MNKNNKRVEIHVKNLPSRYETLDIGKQTIKEYSKVIKNAKTIYFKGPPGFYGKKSFSLGTKEILKAIKKSKAYSIVGGGHSLDAVKRFISKKDISYISLAGGALSYSIAGKKLPGVEALKIKKVKELEQCPMCGAYAYKDLTYCPTCEAISSA